MKKIVIENSMGKRIDAYLMEELMVSRSKVQKMIKENFILVNDATPKSSYTLKDGDVILVEEYIEEESFLAPIKMDLDVVYEDDDVIIINKPNGLVVHPGVGNKSNTLVNGLLYHFKNLSSLNGEDRPGIVHRIDAYTTGLLMVAKNDFAHEKLANQLEKKTTKRKYVALVWGVIKNDTGTIDAPIGRDSNDRKKQAVTSANSKESVTHFKVIKRFKEVTLIELELETGRTHQIRVHMNYIGYPIVNDSVYGKRKLVDDSGQCLHAKMLGFIHPRTDKYMEFDSEIPESFIKVMNCFE